MVQNLTLSLSFSTALAGSYTTALNVAPADGFVDDVDDEEDMCLLEDNLV